MLLRAPLYLLTINPQLWSHINTHRWDTADCTPRNDWVACRVRPSTLPCHVYMPGLCRQMAARLLNGVFSCRFGKPGQIGLLQKKQTQLRREITAGKHGNRECFAGVGGLCRIASGEITNTCPLHTSNIHTLSLTLFPFVIDACIGAI